MLKFTVLYSFQRFSILMKKIPVILHLVTHIVTVVDEENVCNRTMKYLLGVLTGKWIVSFDCKYDVIRLQSIFFENYFVTMDFHAVVCVTIVPLG